MNKNKILEYFEGTPDVIYDTDNHISWHWDGDGAMCFGFFPSDLDGSYKFMTGYFTHQKVAKQAAWEIVGNAKGHVPTQYVQYWMAQQCYEKSYCIGRYWEINTDKYPSLIAFWNLPSSEMMKVIADKLKLNKSRTYVIMEDSMQDYTKNMTVFEYINNGFSGDDGEEEKSKPFKIDPRIADEIRSYNKPNETWQSQKEKKGWNSIAQRNAMIYQEEKEPKKTIKENKQDMKNNKYQEEFSNYTKIMNEALQKGDYRAYEYAKDILEEVIEESKHEKALMEEMNTTNFGILNHIFENELPTLIKTNRKAVKNVINTIKEDKNLMNQFSFYNVIKEQYNSKHDEMIGADAALQKLASIVCEDIDQNSIKKSNKKLRDVMVENNIVPSDFVDEESRKLYENGNVILTTKRNSNNMITLVESYDEVSKWMKRHKDDKKNDNKDADEMIREFEERLKTNLNESEISFVQQITNFRSPIAEQRKEKLFNKLKNECIESIGQMLKEDENNVELKGLNTQIQEMKFNKESIVKDIAKLLEIRDILLEN